MSVLWYGLVSFVLLQFWGLGAALLVLPPRYARYTLVLAPQLGYALMSLSSWCLYAHNVGGTDRYIAALQLLPAALLLAAGWRRKLPLLAESWNAPGLAMALLTLAGYVLMMYPLLLDDHLTSFTIGGNDIAFYGWVSRYVKEWIPQAPSGLFASFDVAYHVNSRYGAFFLVAALSGALHLEPWQLLNLASGVFFGISVATCYAVAREVFGYSHRGALGVSLIYLFNPMMTYVVQNGFYPQVVAGTLSLCLLLLVRDARTAGAQWLLWWGVLITYPHMLPLTLLPIAVWLWFSGQPRALLWTLLAAFVSVFMSGDKPGMLLHEFTRSTDWPCPWHIALVMPYKFFSYTFDRNPHVWRDVVISIPVVVFFLRGLRTLVRTNRPLFLTVASLTLSIIAGYLLISVQNLHLPGDAGGYVGGYRAWKVLGYFVPQVLLGLFAPFGNVPDAGPATLRAARGMSLFLLYELFFLFSSVYAVVKIPGDTPALAQVESDASYRSFNLVDPVGKGEWQVMWEAYFLARKPLFFRYAVYAAPASAPQGDWMLESSAEKPSSAAVVVNPAFHLVKAP